MSEQEKEFEITKEVVDDDVKDILKRVTRFIPFLNLSQPLSDSVTGGTVGPGHWTLGAGDDLVIIDDEDYQGTGKDDLNRGGIVDVYVVDVRPHAIILQNKQPEAESFDPQSDAFKAIEAEEKRLKKAKVDGRAANVGLDILFYLTKTGQAAIYFAKGTAIREAEKILAYKGKGPIRLGVRKIVGKFTWWVPRVHGDAQVPAPLDGKLLELDEATFKKARDDERAGRSADAVAPNAALPPR